jgi:hypothetical protein
MTALALLVELRRCGVQFVAAGSCLRVIYPKGRPLPGPVKDEIARYRMEILRRLRAGGLADDLVVDVFPGAETLPATVAVARETEATVWLRAKLGAGPQHIASLVAEWVGTMNDPTGRDLDDLMQARWALKIEAYMGKDARLWWRLSAESVQ